MGLDAAFIVVSTRHKYPIQVRELRKDYEIHRIMTEGVDTFIEAAAPLECVVAKHHGITNQVITWNYYRTLPKALIDKVWGQFLIMMDTEHFVVMEDAQARGRPELERLVLAATLIDWYYPGLGDTLVYAWSE